MSNPPQPAHPYAVEFIGGPFDGYRHVVTVPPTRLPDTMAFPINVNVFQMLDGHYPGPKQPASSTAVYGLHPGTGLCQYRFLGPEAPLHQQV